MLDVLCFYISTSQVCAQFDLVFLGILLRCLINGFEMATVAVNIIGITFVLAFHTRCYYYYYYYYYY
jgi:hypothetical protein